MRPIITLLSLVLLLSGCGNNIETSSSQGQAIKNLLKDSNQAAVIKFYADWCSSCKDYSPHFEQVAQKYKDKVLFLNLNAEDKANASIVKELQISRIPETVFVSQDRNRISKRLGPISEQNLSELVEALILGQ